MASLKALQENKPYEIQWNPKGSITLTLIPARHCPGAVMFLVESPTKSVLITGDIRAEKDWVEAIPRNEFLYPYTTSIRQLDNIYLDTTYGYRGEPFIEMTPNYYGLQALMELIKSYPQDDSISFHFADSITGFEEAWVRVVRSYGEKMHVLPDLRKRLTMLSKSSSYEYKGSIDSIASSSPKEKFHCCGNRPTQCSNSLSKFAVRIKHCIDINIKDLLALTLPLSFKQFEHELIFVEKLESGHSIYKMDGVPYLLLNGTDDLLRSELRFFFSRHSSYEECRHFVSMFNVKEVYPMTESPKTWENGFQMKRQFGDLCANDEFIYDSISTKTYGPAPTHNLPPLKIDKFDETVFLKSWHQENRNRTLAQPSVEFEFRGINSVKNSAFRTDLDIQEVQVIQQQTSLFKKNKILEGISQYKVQKKMKSYGASYLRKYEDHHSMSLKGTQSMESPDELNSIEQAIYQLNQTRRDLSSLAKPAKRIKNSPIKPPAPRILQSPFVPNIRLKPNTTIKSTTSVTTLDIDESPSSIQPAKSQVSFWKRRIVESPTPFQSQRRKLDAVDFNKISQIDKAVQSDENYGFFQFNLESCVSKIKESLNEVQPADD